MNNLHPAWKPMDVCIAKLINQNKGQFKYNYIYLDCKFGTGNKMEKISLLDKF